MLGKLWNVMQQGSNDPPLLPDNVKKILAQVGIVLILLGAMLLTTMAKPSPALALSTTHYSTSHYVNFSSSSQTISTLNNWAIADAAREDPLGDANSCAPNYYSHDLVTVLDFGQPWSENGEYGARNWTYNWFNFGSIALFAYDYALDYYENSSVCSHVIVAIGISNSGECGSYTQTTCIYNEGYYLASAVEVAENDVTTHGNDLQNQITMEGGDDIEYSGTSAWDPYYVTVNLLDGFNAYATKYSMIDYGNAYIPSCGQYNASKNCGTNVYPYYYTWDYGEIYNVAWGIGLDVPLPESYPNTPAQEGGNWKPVYNNTPNGCPDCIDANHMNFTGVMSEDGWNDPSNQYGSFYSTVGATPVAGYDTCMPYSTNDTTAPCY